MTKHVSKDRYRGVVSVRAEGADANALLASLNNTFEEFKAQNDKRLKELEKGKDDVVQREQVDRINAEMTKMQDQLTETNKCLAAAQLGGAGNVPGESKEKREYNAAFDNYFRRDGDKYALNDLAVKASMSAGSSPDGGVLVPDPVATSIDTALGAVSAMRRLAGVQSGNAAAYKKIINEGGTSAGWVAETGARSVTATAQLSALEFPAMELYAMPAASQTLLDDASLDIGAWLGNEVALTFAEQEGAAFISGSGSGMPKGILAYTNVQDDSRGSGELGYIATGAAAAFAASNPADKLIDLVYALKSGYRANASWLMNRKVCAEVRKFKDADGNYLWQPSAVAGQPATLLGYPVADDDNMSDLGANAFPIAFGDFKRGYLIYDRAGIRVLRDPYSQKPYVLFYTTKRVAGGVSNFEAIKLMKCEA